MGTFFPNYSLCEQRPRTQVLAGALWPLQDLASHPTLCSALMGSRLPLLALTRQ